jgi:hypothetical protein
MQSGECVIGDYLGETMMHLQIIQRFVARAALVIFGVAIVAACSKSAEEVSGGPAGIGFTEFVVEVRTDDGAPLSGARVRADLVYNPQIPPIRFGPVSTNASGRVTLRDRYPCCGWIPANVFVDPPDGSNLVGVIRQDSAYSGPVPGEQHVVQVTLSAPET